MNAEDILIPARIDRQTFRRFSLFDTFRLRKQWRRPLLFALMMSVFAGLCFAFRAQREGAALLGSVLLILGLGLPAAYFLSYFLSLRQQLRRMDPQEAKIAYTLRLGQDGIQVNDGRQRQFYSWDTIEMACRMEGCIYIYTGPCQAYLLPAGEREPEVWALLEASLPGRCRVVS